MYEEHICLLEGAEKAAHHSLEVLKQEHQEFTDYVAQIKEGLWEEEKEGRPGPLKKQYAEHISVTIPEDYTMPEVFTAKEVQDRAVEYLKELEPKLKQAQTGWEEAKGNLKKEKELAIEKRKEEQQEKRYQKALQHKEDRNDQLGTKLIIGLFVFLGVLIGLRVFKII